MRDGNMKLIILILFWQFSRNTRNIQGLVIRMLPLLEGMIHSPRGVLARGKWWKELRVEICRRSQKSFRKKELFTYVHIYIHRLYILCIVYVYTMQIWPLLRYIQHTYSMHPSTYSVGSAAKKLEQARYKIVKKCTKWINFKVWNFG